MKADPVLARLEPVTVFEDQHDVGDVLLVQAVRYLPGVQDRAPAAIAERFDVVLCIGNSLVHAAGRDAMIGALTGLREMARPGGHVVVDSRNWEKLHAEHRIVQLADSAVTRHGRTCIVLYAWEIPDRLDQEHVAHIVLIFQDGSRIEPREYRIGFHPFTVGDLRERLEAAGLKEVDTDFDDARDRYAITAVPA
jgi:hypothetical protein